MKDILIAVVVYIAMRVIEIKVFPIDATIMRVMDGGGRKPGGGKMPVVTSDAQGRPISSNAKVSRVIDNGNGTSTIMYDNGQYIIAVNPN